MGAAGLALMLFFGMAASAQADDVPVAKPAPAPTPTPAPVAAPEPPPVASTTPTPEIAAKLGVKARALTLVEALRTALKTNATLAQSVVEVDIAHAQAMATGGADDMILSADARYTRRRSDPVAGSPFQNTGNDQLDTSVGLVKPLRSGACWARASQAASWARSCGRSAMRWCWPWARRC